MRSWMVLAHLHNLVSFDDKIGIIPFLKGEEHYQKWSSAEWKTYEFPPGKDLNLWL